MLSSAAILDIAVIGAVVVAGLLGLWLGVARILLGIGSWAGAAVLTVYGMPLLRPVARGWIESPLLADLAAAAAVFLTGLVFFTVLTHMIAERVRSGALGAVDRSVGLVAGLVLGISVASVGYLVFERMTAAPGPEGGPPAWVLESKTAPVLGWTGRFLFSLLPEEWRRAAGGDSAAPAPPLDADGAAKKLMIPVPENPEPKERPGYSQDERREMDRLFNANQ